MQDLQLIIEFIMLNIRNISILYSTYLILGLSFSVFILDKIFGLYHKIKNHS